MDDPGVLVTRHKLDVDDYYRMADAGILDEHDRIELIDGELIDMAPIGQDHASTVSWLTRALVLAFSDRAIVSPQNPVRLDQLNEPQPDFAVLRPRADFYRTGDRPGPHDVLFLVEVSDSSLRFDRSIKLPLYARVGVPEVWIVDLKRRAVDVHRGPRDGAYVTMTTHQAGETLSPSLAPDLKVTLDRLFG